jgi:hypothetical protein
MLLKKDFATLHFSEAICGDGLAFQGSSYGSNRTFHIGVGAGRIGPDLHSGCA